MPDLTYPGVYIQEKPGAPSPIAGVATSTFGLLGFTRKGPINDPVLVTGFKEFERRFGGFIAQGLVPTMLHAFFKNGGSLARIVRVVGAGAANAVAYISEAIVDEDSGDNGDGATTAFTWTAASSPLEPGSFEHSHQIDGTPVVAATAVSTAPDGVIVIWKTLSPSVGQGQFVPATFTSAIKPGSVTITWASTGAKTMTDDGAGSFTGDGNAAGSTIDYLTGAIVFDATGDIPDSGLVSTITVSYTPQIAYDAVDDGGGAITGTNIASGTIDYDTGAIAVTYTVAPSTVIALTGATSATQDLVFSYGQALWQVNLRWPGLAGNDYRLELFGAQGFEVDATATFTRWTLNLLELDADGEYEVVESYADMDFVDSGSSDFFPLVVNDENAGSSIIEIVDLGNTGVPSALSGVAQVAEVIGTGTGSLTQFTGTLAGGSCAETTLSITVDALTVTDDGQGSLIGNVDPTGINTINYTTGAFNVTFASAPTAVSILASYYTEGDDSDVNDFTGGLDGSAVTTSETVSATLEAGDEGLYAFNKTDDLLLLSIPDFAGDEITDGALIDYCEQRMDRFAILATPESQDFNQAINYKKRTLNKNTTSYAAIYHPWITILDPVTEKALNVPPVGHVAGVYARTDSDRNVGKAPAGANDGALRFIIGLETEYTQAQVGQLNVNRVNALINWPQVGTFAVWGARTLQISGEFGYIQARRLFQFVEKSIFNATHIYVFENNGSALWARIRLQLQGFLLRLFQNGYFAGDTPEQAFFVIVDGTNNPQTSIDAGVLNIDIGIAPNKPAEFIVFSFQQKLPG